MGPSMGNASLIQLTHCFREELKRKNDLLHTLGINPATLRRELRCEQPWKATPAILPDTEPFEPNEEVRRMKKFLEDDFHINSTTGKHIILAKEKGRKQQLRIGERGYNESILHKLNVLRSGEWWAKGDARLAEETVSILHPAFPGGPALEHVVFQSATMRTSGQQRLDELAAGAGMGHGAAAGSSDGENGEEETTTGQRQTTSANGRGRKKIATTARGRKEKQPSPKKRRGNKKPRESSDDEEGGDE